MKQYRDSHLGSDSLPSRRTMRFRRGGRARTFSVRWEPDAHRRLQAQVMQWRSDTSSRPPGTSNAARDCDPDCSPGSAPTFPHFPMGQPRRPTRPLGLGSETQRDFFQRAAPKPKAEFSALPETGSATDCVVCITMRVDPRPYYGRRVQAGVSRHSRAARLQRGRLRQQTSWVDNAQFPPS